MFETGKRIHTDDAALFVSEAGNPEGQPIVLLHGGLGSRNDFQLLAQQLTDEYRLIAIDSRGHGRSEIGMLPLTYKQLEEDCTAVMEKLGITHAGIIGHSDGGIVALRLAASGSVQPRFIVAAGTHWTSPANESGGEILRGATVQKWQEKFAEKVKTYEAENPLPDFSKLFYATQAMWLGSDDQAYPGASVQSIISPFLVIHGDRDFLVSRRQAYELVQQVKDAVLLNLPFATHALFEDSVMQILPALKGFISLASLQI